MQMKNNLFENFQHQRWIFSTYNDDEVAQIAKTFSIDSTLAKVLIHNVSSDLKQLKASVGVFTIGSPLTLKEVFINTGQSVFSLNFSNNE